MEREIKKINHHGREVFGYLYLPEGKGIFPIVIFSHGYNGSGDDFAEYAAYLTERGVAAFCYDFCGGSVRSRSSMKTTEMTIFTEKEDLCAVVTAIRQEPRIDADKVFLFGGSQGGLVSALTADELEDQVRGLILLFPALCIADDWNKRFPEASEIPEKVNFWGMELGRVFFESIQGFATFEHVGHYAKSVLVMHGDRDEVVPVEYSERISRQYPQARLEIFEGEGHGFSEMGSMRAAQLTAEFVEENVACNRCV